MNKLNLALEHCYGIKKLEVNLDYSDSSTVAIYAPNGAMKTSLANTFQDIASGKQTKDRIFQDRVSKRVVQDEAAKDSLKNREPIASVCI